MPRVQRAGCVLNLSLLLCFPMGSALLSLSSQPGLSVRQHAQRLFADWSQNMFPCLHWVPANARGSAWRLVLDELHCSHAHLLNT